MSAAALAKRAPRTPRKIHNPDESPLTNREIIEVMTGLLVALFTAMLSSTIVATALPTIVADLHGTQLEYTWVITASLLAMTVTTPIWGKLADLFNKKALVQVAIVIFVAGSVGAGFSQNMGTLIALRVLQGLGMGGLTALTQAVMGSIIPPRRRGRYSGLMGSVMAVSTVGGPILGGVIVDSSLGWRWCFFVCIPLAIIALILLQLTLHLETEERHPTIDFLGAGLIAATAASPLLWVTFAGKNFDWWSWQTGAFLGGAVVGLILTIVVELHAVEPIIPLRKLAHRNTVLILIASVAVGIGMFGSSTFMTQYFQLARGYQPTHAGLLTLPLVISMLIASTLVGLLVSRTGKWKWIMVVGSVLLSGGLLALGGMDHQTPIWQLGIFMAIMGIGIGSMMQNLVLAVQNSVDVRDIGAVSATVAFFRSLGGAVGVSVLGAVLADRVQVLIFDGVVALGPGAASAGGRLPSQQGSMDVKSLPEPIKGIVMAAFGDATGRIFTIAGLIAILAIIALLFVKEVVLRDTVTMVESVETTAAVASGESAERFEEQQDDDDVLVGAERQTPAGRSNGYSAYRPAEQPAGNHAASDFAGAELNGSLSQNGQAGRVQEKNSADDPSERTALAALDVLAVAQEEADAQHLANRDAAKAAQDRLSQLGREVDAVLGHFHREIATISADLDQTGLEPPQRRAAAESLRAYEFTLLRGTQENAERVVGAAQEQADRILAEARAAADRLGRQSTAEADALNREIAALRVVEQDLRQQVDAHLSE